MLLGDLYFDWVPTPMTLEQFNDYHDCSLTPRQFHILKKAVPPAWHKAIINGSADSAEPENILNVFQSKGKTRVSSSISKFSCKIFYNELTSEGYSSVQKKFLNRKTEFYPDHWRQLGKIPWSKVFSRLFTNHLDRKSIDIIYRYIHSGIWTRSKAFNAKLSDHRLCTRCYAVPEDCNHIFVNCQYSQEMWETTFQLLQKLCPEIKISNSLRYVLVGFSDLKECKKVLQVMEDIRLAYIKSVWKQRNSSLFDQMYLPGVPILRQNILSYFQTRFDLAQRKGVVTSFEPYLKLCKISKNYVVMNTF